jgi:hypothetical protein
MPKAGNDAAALVYSQPTKCLHCHLVVEMFHEKSADPVKGSWVCPKCGHQYLFSHWKIKQAKKEPSRRQPKAA